MSARGCSVVLACIGFGLTLGAVAGAAAQTRVPTFASAKYYRLGSEPRALAAGDLNGDGKPDLATAEFRSSTVAVLLNKGDGTFGAKREYETGLDPFYVAIGDLNGDGKPELVTANVDGGGYLSVLPGRGDGTFDEGSRLDYRGGGASLAIGDLNGDGRQDLVTTSFGENEKSLGSVLVLLNRGDGTFLPHADYPVGIAPVSVAIADVSGDGKADLAVANAGGNTLSVLMNRGDGTFAARVSYRSGKGPVAAAAADLNHDGKADLVTTNGAPWTVSVLLNQGNGTFRAKHDYDVDAEVSLAIGDLNGDGSPDLATANPTNPGSLVFVLFNKGDGTFRTEYEYELEYATRNPIAVAISDLNGDGRQDLATVSVAGPGYPVSILINKPNLCNVQYVLEVRLAIAKRATARANCRVGKVRRAYSNYVRKGLVISQKPKFGAVLRGGSRVELVISKGRKR